jgi:Gas vesicle protein
VARPDGRITTPAGVIEIQNDNQNGVKIMSTTRIPTATSSTSIADILERVLDMGVVIAGDIRIKLVDIELLSIQIRLVVCSVEKAKEIGMDWWNLAIEKKNNAADGIAKSDASELASRLEAMEQKMKEMERVGVRAR